MIELGEPGAAFVAERLGDGRTLSRLLLAELGEEPRVTTWWPDGAPTDRARRPQWGGLPAGAGAGQLAWVVGLVAEHLGGEGALAVFESNLARPGDPWLARLAEPVWAHRDEVYHPVPAGAGPDTVGAVLRAAEQPWLVGALATLDAPPAADRRAVDADELAAVASGADAVVMSAYDEEGYVVARRR